MGVIHPKQIVRFSVNSVDYIDVLQIAYDRPKGSLLPVTRTYRFPRIQKTLDAGASGKPGKVVMESDPALREAVDELRAVLGAKESKQDLAAEMLEELRRMQTEFELHNECLKEMIGRMESD